MMRCCGHALQQARDTSSQWQTHTAGDTGHRIGPIVSLCETKKCMTTATRAYKRTNNAFLPERLYSVIPTKTTTLTRISGDFTWRPQVMKADDSRERLKMLRMPRHQTVFLPLPYHSA